MQPRLLLLIVVALVPEVAHAGGTYAGDAGAQAQQRGGAFVAKADDPTAMALNPAGLIGLEGSALFIGVNVVDFRLSYDRADVYQTEATGADMPEIAHDGPWQPVPMLALALRATPRLAFGVAIHAPQGYPSRNLPATVDVNGATLPAPQRYDVIDQEALVAMGSLGAAYRLHPDLDAGVRLSWGVATLSATSTVWGGVNPSEDPGFDSEFALDVRDRMIPSFGAGLRWRASRELELGIGYASSQTLALRGHSTAVLGAELGFLGQQAHIIPVEDADAACAPGGRADALATCVTLVLPQSAQAGVRWVFREAGRERADLEIDLRWEDWSAARDVTIVVDGRNDFSLQRLEPSTIRHGFEDVWSVRAGGSWRFHTGVVTVEPRLGVGYETAAAPDSWQRVDIDGAARLHLAAGVAVEVGRFRLELGAASLRSPDRVAPRAAPSTTPPRPGEPPVDERMQPDAVLPNESPDRQYLHPINSGRYRSGTSIVSLGLTVAW